MQKKIKRPGKGLYFFDRGGRQGAKGYSEMKNQFKNKDYDRKKKKSNWKEIKIPYFGDQSSMSETPKEAPDQQKSKNGQYEEAIGLKNNTLFMERLNL